MKGIGEKVNGKWKTTFVPPKLDLEALAALREAMPGLRSPCPCCTETSQVCKFCDPAALFTSLK